MGGASFALATKLISINIREKSFGTSCVLKNVKFDLQPNETLAITGPSGVGKTTLLRIVAGLDTDYVGSVSRPDQLAMVFQEPTLLPWRTARENICLLAHVSESQAEDALSEVGLAGKSDQFPAQLSLGQQRRLALARAFATKPKLLLMDEPFVSLDPELVEEMLVLTEKLLASRAIATILVTHSKMEATRLATRDLQLTKQTK